MREGSPAPPPERSRDERVLYARLRAAFANEALSDHLALFYRNREEQLLAVTAFLVAGLETGERCLYLVDENEPETIERRLAAAGVDVDRRREAGDLVIEAAADGYPADGFDAERALERIATRATESRDRGYERLRVAGEHAWGGERSFEPVLAFEVAFENCRTDLPCTAMCQYDLERHDSTGFADLIAVHEHVVFANTVCENPYYVPPAEFDDRGTAVTAETMLKQLYSLTRNGRELAEREQRLRVLHRVLRHNVRNDLNVVKGSLESIDSAGLDPTSRRHLEVAIDHVETIERLSEKARRTERTLDRETGLESIDLGEVVETVVAAVSGAYPDAVIGADPPSNCRVVATSRIDEAIRELVVNGVRHSRADPAVVRLSVVETDETVELEVLSNGDPISETEQRALSSGLETQLEHASGLGLWIVAWIVDRSLGDVSFESADGDCLVRITLHRLEPEPA